MTEIKTVEDIITNLYLKEPKLVDMIMVKVKKFGEYDKKELRLMKNYKKYLLRKELNLILNIDIQEVKFGDVIIYNECVRNKNNFTTMLENSILKDSYNLMIYSFVKLILEDNVFISVILLF